MVFSLSNGKDSSLAIIIFIQCSLANANSVKAKFRITRILTTSPCIAPFKTCTIKVLLSRIRVMTVLTHKRGGAFDIYNGAMTGKRRATDLASKVAIINAVETRIETNSEKLDATNCLGVPYLLF